VAELIYTDLHRPAGCILGAGVAGVAGVVFLYTDRIPFCRWNNLSQQEQKVCYDAFLTDTGIKCSSKPKTVTSSDGSLTVTGTSKVARKPGQRKRPQAERAAPKNEQCVSIDGSNCCIVFSLCSICGACLKWFVCINHVHDCTVYNDE